MLINDCHMIIKIASIFKPYLEKTCFRICKQQMSLVMGKPTARGLKFRIKEVEGLYYPCSENKGADQLRGYREADLRLCFRICKTLNFTCCGSNMLIRQPFVIHYPDSIIPLCLHLGKASGLG